MEKSGQSDAERRVVTDDAMESNNNKKTSQCLEGLEARFVHRCEVDLRLDEKTSADALHLFKISEQLILSNLIGTGTVQEAERLWSSWILFAVNRLANGVTARDDRTVDNLVRLTLSQILKVTKLSLVEFFKDLPQVLLMAGPNLKAMYGHDWERRLKVKEIQTDFYYVTVLFNYYRRMYENLFSSVEEPFGTSSGLSSGTNGESGPSVHLRFGWILFLVLRIRVLNQFVDLVTYINGLLAVIITLILQMPPSLRKFSLEDECFFKERRADGQVKLIPSLCALYHDASEEDVSNMVDKTNSMIGKVFRKSNGFRTRSHSDQLAGVDTEGLVYFDGLMDDRSITANLHILDKDYEEAYQSRGEVDERIFVNGELLTGPLSSDSQTSSGIKRKHDTLSSLNQEATVSTGACPPSPSSLLPSPKSNSVTNIRIPPPTPVSVTMSTLKWLRTCISPLTPHPSPELQRFLQACDHDISGEVTHRAQVLFDKIFLINGTSTYQDSRGTVLLDRDWVEQRRLEAAKLYYRVLTAMCKAVNNNPTAFLTNERFHRCMIACSAELVLYAHKTVTMTFPAVLEPTGITAFDFSKVSEGFVRNEKTLPWELKRHLNSMEQQILESIAWEKGSSMYNSLILVKKHLAPVISELCLLADPMPVLNNTAEQISNLSINVGRKFEGACVEGAGVPVPPEKVATCSPSSRNGPFAFTNGVGNQVGNLSSPSKERPSASPVKAQSQRPLQSVFASPQKPSGLGGGEICAETSIKVFFLKVLTVSGARIKDLCERLHLSVEVCKQVYRAMEHLLYMETSLFFKRHIDQLILCSIYGVCKVYKENVTFKKCLEHYKKQPQCKRHVFCNVLLKMPSQRGEGESVKGQETGDIIMFYNQVFVPTTKQYLMQLGEKIKPRALTTAHPGDEHRNDKDGCGQVSPMVSFPACPDKFPKKVSALHNVRASPLQKIEVGTNKDINNVVNNRHPGGQMFNMDSLVRDSQVAWGLNPCTWSAVHLTADSVGFGQSQPSFVTVAPLQCSPMKCPRSDR